MNFSKELSVGNRILDSEHKKLHGTINEIARSIAAKDNTALLAAFELLENALRAYFVIEENIAQAVDFDFTQHRLAHQGLLNKFQRIKVELIAKNGMSSKFDDECYIDSLRNCLIRHIKVDDKPLKIVLETYFYDFKPDSVVGTPVLHGCG